jgi:hypothetical protein
MFRARPEDQAAGDMDVRAHPLECDRLYPVEAVRAVVE